MRNIAAALNIDEEVESFEEQKVQIIEELVAILVRNKNKILPDFRDVPKKK